MKLTSILTLALSIPLIVGCGDGSEYELKSGNVARPAVSSTAGISAATEKVSNANLTAEIEKVERSIDKILEIPDLYVESNRYLIAVVT